MYSTIFFHLVMFVSHMFLPSRAPARDHPGMMFLDDGIWLSHHKRSPSRRETHKTKNVPSRDADPDRGDVLLPPSVKTTFITVMQAFLPDSAIASRLFLPLALAKSMVAVPSFYCPFARCFLRARAPARDVVLGGGSVSFA
jgi:hypothetical protein